MVDVINVYLVDTTNLFRFYKTPKFVIKRNYFFIISNSLMLFTISNVYFLICINSHSSFWDWIIGNAPKMP